MNVHNNYRVASNIYVKADNLDSPFLKKIKNALAKISSCSVGQRLIKKIGEGNHPLVICHTEGPSQSLANHMGYLERGKGAGTTVNISYKNVTPLGLRPIDNPFFITLAHELIHALHNSKGKNAQNTKHFSLRKWSSDEEFKTIVGFRSKKFHRKLPKITENAIRAEHNLPLRSSHMRAPVYIECSAKKVTAVALYILFGVTAGILFGVYSICKAPNST